MNNLGYALDGAWRVLLASLVLGAGLPGVFALGVRALAVGAGTDHGTASPRTSRLGTVVGVLLFAVVIAGVVLGLTFIVASGLGKTLSFEHVLPTLVDKK